MACYVQWHLNINHCEKPILLGNVINKITIHNADHNLLLICIFDIIFSSILLLHYTVQLGIKELFGHPKIVP